MSRRYTDIYQIKHSFRCFKQGLEKNQQKCDNLSCQDCDSYDSLVKMSRVITVYKHIVTASSSPRTAQESPGSLPVRLTFPPPAACYHNNGSLAGDFTQSSQPCVSVSQPPSHTRIEQRLIMPKEIIGTDKM